MAKNKKRILIVGGVAGGASAAARARRLSEDAEIILFERGEHISFANCGLPYHIGGAIKERQRLLVQTPEAMRKRFRVDVRVRTEVVGIDRENKRVRTRNVETGEETSEPYDVLILSPGAEPVRPPIPGVDSAKVLTLRNLRDMDEIIEMADGAKERHAAIVGGGYIGLEMAEALRAKGFRVTLVELAPQVFAPADPEMIAPVHQHLLLHGVDLKLETSVIAFEEKDEGLSVRLSSGESLDCGLAIMAIGVRPEAGLARDAGLAIGETGGILVDDGMRTSDPNIFAVGDAVEVEHFVDGEKALIPLAGPANRQGRIAADNALGRDSVYRQTQGTAICKIFDLAVGMTGLSEKALLRSGAPYEKIYLHPTDHAGYYPGASPISLKLLFSPEDGKILGAQAVGAKGVDKRIDVLAVAMRAGLTVHDLEDLELSYAPPYGSAKDPVNYAGFIASNVLKGDLALCHVQDVVDLTDDRVLVDVRDPKELEAGTIPESVNIPLDELRDRLDELPKEKEILTFCQVGLRGYLACRILTQNGYRCRNLSGGYKTYVAASGFTPPAKPKPATNSENNKMKEEKMDKNSKGCCGADSAPNACKTQKAILKTEVVREIDARSMQCPGPIMRLSDEIEKIERGQAISIVVADPGFPADVAAWCNSTGHQLVETVPVDGCVRATILKAEPAPSADDSPSVASAQKPPAKNKNKTMVVFSGDFDRAMASFIIANGAAAMGSGVTMFFTFWGLNVLRRPEKVKVSKSPVERMFGWMMPRGAGRLTLSKMHMGGLGTAMMKRIMKRKNVQSLSELIDSAKRSGVRLVACSMSMDLMGIHPEELIDGVELGGVAAYLDAAESAGVNLFV